eukprot:15257374-Heterocapsa_arctica.AAC.1
MDATSSFPTLDNSPALSRIPLRSTPSSAASTLALSTLDESPQSNPLRSTPSATASTLAPSTFVKSPQSNSAEPFGKTSQGSGSGQARRKGPRGRQSVPPTPSRLPGSSAKAVVLGDQSKAFERVADAWISQVMDAWAFPAWAK